MFAGAVSNGLGRGSARFFGVGGACTLRCWRHKRDTAECAVDFQLLGKFDRIRFKLRFDASTTPQTTCHYFRACFERCWSGKGEVATAMGSKNIFESR